MHNKKLREATLQQHSIEFVCMNYISTSRLHFQSLHLSFAPHLFFKEKMVDWL